MANERSKFYTSVQTKESNKNRNISKKKYSLPTNLSSFAYNSCLNSIDDKNHQQENELSAKDENINNKININQKECSELIIETQQRLQNLRLESFIGTYPINPYSDFIRDEKQKNNININYTDIINTTKERVNHKRKFNSNGSSLISENNINHKKHNNSNSSNHEKISEVKKIKNNHNSDNNIYNNQIVNTNENFNLNQNINIFNTHKCEINENNNQNNIINKISPYTINDNNNCNINHNLNNVNVNQKKDNVNVIIKNQKTDNINVKNKNPIEPKSDDSNDESDYKKLNNHNNNGNNNNCWAILQSINPKFQTIYLNSESINNNEFTIGRNKNCNIRINLPQISSIHCKIFYTEDKSKISGYVTRQYFLQDLSTYGTFVNEELVGKGNIVNLYNGQSIDLYKSRRTEKCFIFLIPNNIVPNQMADVGYIMNDDIGSGSFGRVCKAIRKSDNCEVAIKIVNKSKLNSKPGSNLMKYLEREVNILKSIQHKNIIQLYDVYEDSTNVYMVLELAKGGELFKRIKSQQKLNENQTRIVMKQLFSALEYIHSRGIAHRDLKPENILMQSTNKYDFSIKLSDFGLSRFVDDNFNMRTLCGTPNYTAPEVFDKNIKNYTIAVDMWSCGVIMYICLCGYPPFSRKTSKYPLKTQILNGLYTFKPEHWSNISEDAIKLIKSLLQVNPNNRLTVSQALNHSFITKENEKMQVDFELKRKREAKSSKNDDELSGINDNSKKNSDTSTDIDYERFSNNNHKNKNNNSNNSNNNNNSNKLKRQKLL
ncbi:Pkinase-domain-containing protein [Anaeromyces robustus]|uniref:Pkinase-domain-containing protein n=1 Tax=Anaeromyces robustus TaxID=1754192 RepID=A0A1Y1XBC1_9FUNG|nr:Pkinase-domain-containing protein [Anaeromyces robustus]|eukprot:ORX83038.1 Pkinase-domain-containing protein [Anaeromyces robustus]